MRAIALILVILVSLRAFADTVPSEPRQSPAHRRMVLAGKALSGFAIGVAVLGTVGTIVGAVKMDYDRGPWVDFMFASMLVALNAAPVGVAGATMWGVGERPDKPTAPTVSLGPASLRVTF
jgi:hypothetical protein